MRLLVLTMDYPRPDGTHERMFVHVRNTYYKKQGKDVTVINFACNYDYEIDGIKVITLRTFEKEKNKYDIAISHASNLRNHYRFLKRHGREFEHLVFFFHGHEILYLNKAYPKPYSYVQSSKLRNGIMQDIYDWLKIDLWKRYYCKIASKAQFIFVSNWIFNQFKFNTGLSEQDLLYHCHIINNSIGTTFEYGEYDARAEKKFDFITIRGNLDGSKYGVDLVVNLAEKNPQLRFLLIGQGNYFMHNRKPTNVEWINKSMNHDEMVPYLNQSKCGLLLTREDTQGVMTCELAAFGIPVITSDIEVCQEFFSAMPNVAMINNDDREVDIYAISEELCKQVPYPKDRTYFAENTIAKEITIFNQLVRMKKEEVNEGSL